MTVTFNSAVDAKVQALFSTIAQALGMSTLDLSQTIGLKAVVQTYDGQAVSCKFIPDTSGPQLATARLSAVVQASGLVVPSSGSADADVESGTTTLVASTIDVTVAGGVPTNAVVYATVTTGAGVPKLLAAARQSATTIRISSAGDGFGSLLASAGVDGTLTAGVNAAVTLANVAGDLLAVIEKTAAGTAADHYSIVRVNDTTVKLQAHQSSGALQSGSTSVVTAYNFGAKGHETSLVRWVVVRP